MSGLGGTMKLPVVGTVKTTYVAVGGALVAGIVGYAYWRRSQADAGPPDGSDGGLFVDTRTGSDLPSDGFVNPAPNADGQSGTGIGGDSVWHAPNTDQEWAQQAIDRLTWYEPGYVSAIVGKYLARQPLTAEEANVIREAWAQIGQPPSRFPIISASTGSGTGGTTPPVVNPPLGTKPPTTKPPVVKPPIVKTAPKPKPASFSTVKVAKFTTKNAPWNSTISGIAAHYGKSWPTVWNYSKNSGLRSSRKKPELIRAGDTVYVPK